ncbi:transmembrane 7 superfamily member 3 [Discoglossus pictus]
MCVPGAMRTPWAVLLLWSLMCGEADGGLLEVSMWQFAELKLDQSPPTEALLKNIPSNVSFVVFQLHTHYQNVTVSFDKIPGINDSETGSDVGLVSILGPEQTNCTWYLESANTDQLLATAVSIPYTERDPVPGGCSLESSLDIDPKVYLQYNLYETVITFAPANLGYARGASPPVCDVGTGEQSRWRLNYEIYQYFLPENNLNETVLLTHLQKMSMVQQVTRNGGKVTTLTSNDRTTMSFSSIPGQGVIYNVIVRDPLLNTSAAYIPVHTYACSFTSTMDNCYTLGLVSTKVFFTIFSLLGLFICFFGHRFLKTEFFFMGFIITGFLFFILISRVTGLDYTQRLILMALFGIIGGLLFVAYWWRCGCVLLCVLISGLVLGFLVASVAFFTPLGDIAVFNSDTVFWLTFSCISLVIPVVLLIFVPKILNVLTCVIVGSYTVVLAIDSYLYTSLSYITLNVLKRALNNEFSTAYTSTPLQTNDFIIIALWAVLVVSGVTTQLWREKGLPAFPPTPYLVWKRDRERRKTNILDPSYHIPPFRERVMARLAQIPDLFRKEPPTGERTPLLL